MWKTLIDVVIFHQNTQVIAGSRSEIDGIQLEAKYESVWEEGSNKIGENKGTEIKRCLKPSVYPGKIKQ